MKHSLMQFLSISASAGNVVDGGRTVVTIGNPFFPIGSAKSGAAFAVLWPLQLVNSELSGTISMPSRQVKDILDHVRGYHHKLGRRFSELSARESDERLALLLKYLAGHEKKFEESLAAYEDDAAKEVLNTWLKFVPDETIDGALKHFDLRDDMDADEIIAAVLAFDKSLIDLYRQLADKAPIARIQEVFMNLLQMEESKDRQYARSVLDL